MFGTAVTAQSRWTAWASSHEAGHSRLEFAHLRDLLPKHAARPQQVILEDGATAKPRPSADHDGKDSFRKSFAVLLRNTMMLVSNVFSDKLETLPTWSAPLPQSTTFHLESNFFYVC